ncbi:hypothetical protein M422DRAFT_256513 [Sphaerobolus stellatus SS14]|uniref:Uncharacterized protein n=1 Tax=Sphaerobolus stellatus (strain SS14) TaxID=990650 RepID=A0A0C9UBM6_SPHS4|nr:hypothetical protein M422DRAFT_256513 [Sphaerobolus stellatus SS14]
MEYLVHLFNDRGVSSSSDLKDSVAASLSCHIAPGELSASHEQLTNIQPQDYFNMLPIMLHPSPLLPLHHRTDNHGTYGTALLQRMPKLRCFAFKFKNPIKPQATGNRSSLVVLRINLLPSDANINQMRNISTTTLSYGRERTLIPVISNQQCRENHHISAITDVIRTVYYIS